MSADDTTAPDPEVLAAVEALIAYVRTMPTEREVREMAQRTVDETVRQVNDERTRLLLKDQLRMLVFGDDPDFALMAGAEMLVRDWVTWGSDEVPAANGDQAEVRYDDKGGVSVRVSRSDETVSFPFWFPATGRA